MFLVNRTDNGEVNSQARSDCTHTLGHVIGKSDGEEQIGKK